MIRRKRARPMSRRDFLGLAGMAAVGGGISCIGSVLGYLALDRIARAGRSAALPSTPDVTRAARIKQVERPYITPRAEWNAREPNHDAENEKGLYSAENPEGWREYEGDLRLIYKTVVVHHSVIYGDDDITTMRAIQ
ncbi:MAG TPA: twin-arginine translocation signal domain-containing protein, partial [Aggregatilineaceae bacterium]|nr:twin-arginine translocation signal domain-containing protein [Aggregatilineaceae bacterium]